MGEHWAVVDARDAGADRADLEPAFWAPRSVVLARSRAMRPRECIAGTLGGACRRS